MIQYSPLTALFEEELWWPQ